MLLDMHWLDEARPTPRASPAPPPRRARARSWRAPAGFLRPELACLGSLVGRWTTEIDYHQGGWTTQDLRTRGTTDVRVARDGAALVLESQVSGWMGAAHDHAVITPDPTDAEPGSDANHLRLYVVDSFSSTCQRYRGFPRDADHLVFDHPAVMLDRPGVLRRTLRLDEASPSWTVAFWTEDDVTRLVTARLRRPRTPEVRVAGLHAL